LNINTASKNILIARIASSFISPAIEFYDFYIYGIAVWMMHETPDDSIE
jgi:hypothetical protein